jgi:thiol:disulfide interchange protein DsbD
MRRLITTITILTFVLGISAQLSNPVHFSAQLRTENGVDAEIIFTAKIDAGWHVYSTELGNNGPISATFNAVKMDGVETIGKLQARGNEIKQFDKLFEMELRYFEQAATFVQKVRFTKPDYDIDCYLEYGACNDQACLPPSEAAFKQKGKSPIVKEKTEKAEDVTDQVTPVPSLSGEDTDTAAIMPPLQTVSSDSLWSPVVEELRAMGGNDAIADHSLLYILLMGFIGGLLAVCMPCIWPIIPMTVSFFLKRAKSDKKKGIRDAFTYGISIIVIYLGLGLLVTALFGSDTLNAMSTNAVFNIFLFLLLVVFALSFFGWFEIKLPESWANSVDTKATETSGLISIFLMAFTLVLVSFSCTAPIIGLLLVETTTSGNWLAPALGMLGFAVALALPFTLFAMFPSWLKQAPKSGSWMNTLKIVLGFIELAFALKFFSVADLAYGWHLLDREVFLSLWIVIFALLGVYLCGWLKFQTDEIGGNLHKPMPVVCIMGGLVSLAFAVYMIPGLWGAPCKAVSAFAPPMNTQDFNLNTKTVEAKYTDYDEGMAAAKALGKPVLIDFTGFGCVNCRKMEAAVWTDPTVADMLTDDFVLISLYVDDKTPLAEPLEVTTSQDETKILRTVGAKWSWLQSQKFGANAQPFYVMLDNNGKPLSASRAYDEDVNGYINFLKQGLLKYQQ